MPARTWAIWAYCRNGQRCRMPNHGETPAGDGEAHMDVAIRSEAEVANPRGVPIKDVAQILGVPMPTLRSWELRYGIPTLSRGRGQHRRYLPDEVNVLRLMRDEIARGQPAGVAAESVRRLLSVQGPAQDLILQILRAAERLDAASIRARLDDAVDTLGLAATIDDVLLPAMRQIGVWWAIGHCDVVQERMATEAVRAWLDRRSAFAPPPSRSRPPRRRQRRPGSLWCPIWRPDGPAPSRRSAPSATWVSTSSMRETHSSPRAAGGASRAGTWVWASKMPAQSSPTRWPRPTNPARLNPRPDRPFNTRRPVGSRPRNYASCPTTASTPPNRAVSDTGLASGATFEAGEMSAEGGQTASLPWMAPDSYLAGD